MLRSGYTTRMKFRSDSDDLTPVIWYRVPNSRPFVPFYNLYSSINWNSKQSSSKVGEQQGETRRWYNGKLPAPFEGDSHFCGTRAAWRNGATTADPDLE